MCNLFSRLENSIGAEGARALAESLKQNMTLIRLDIEGTSEVG